jgi:O-antigen/teichoic acid export membrane protein
MSLKANILATYLSQAYTTLASILILPLYIHYMGAEAYGLVGFFTLLQVWFSLLDMGLSPMLARETARFHGGQLDAGEYRKLVRALEGIFVLTAIGGGGALFVAAGYIARHWLHVTQLDINQVQTALQLMAVSIAIRWLGGLYRSTISGAERLVWLSGFSAAITSLRFLGILPILLWVDASPKTFFLFQLGVAILETVCLWFYAYRWLPAFPANQHSAWQWDWAPLRNVYRFSLGIAFASVVWIMITQVDKLILSHLLPLAEYGYFTLAVLVASSVTLISTPISTAIMPRMAKLEAAGNTRDLIQLYRQTTQWVSVIAGSAAITLALCAETLLRVWTNNPFIAQQAAPILLLYAVGNVILAVSAFPYYLQYAKGDLRLHLIGNTIFIILLVPLMVWAAQSHGAIGAGYAWLAINLLIFTLWLPNIHRKFVPSLNKHWYSQDILLIAASAAFSGYCVNSLLPTGDNHWIQLTDILLTGLSAFLAGAAASSDIRTRILTRYKNDNVTAAHLRLHRHL